MIVLDASVLIGYLDREDAHHGAAVELLAAAVDDDLGVNALTLAEVLVGPTRTGQLDTARAFLRDLEVTELPFPPDAAFRLAHVRVATGLKLPDCCVLLTATAAAGRVASFDHGLRQAARRQGVPLANRPTFP